MAGAFAQRLTDAATTVLDEALRLALASGRNYIEPAHIMSALRRPDARNQLQLMDSGLAHAARLSADVRIEGRAQDFELPVWRDQSGDIRIGLPKLNPEHSGDIDQIVVSVGDLLSALGAAVA